ncbi:hypothetical protein COHA_007314 [Chlorella ohadii]|uniref:Protein kinase domain-containing protein n=1 Tax=Chlorella ohadii TaxID=2649997 RepID=A0AAD5H2T8_9CHLO|nr:hypothetical protein COHA_007314 [Chlorella ohadii]
MAGEIQQAPSRVTAACMSLHAVAALLAQRQAINNWDAFAASNSVIGWDTATPVCSWTGIVCKANSTTANKFDINLSCAPVGRLPCATKAQGTLAPELAELSTLGTIALEGQALSGGLPAAWGAPGALPALYDLKLSGNALTGSLPETWGGTQAFPSLFRMELSGNQLSGSVPAGWGARGSFLALRYFIADGNLLTGTLPSGWGQPGSSQTFRLDLSSNRLSGTLPPEWGAQNVFPQLEYLQSPPPPPQAQPTSSSSSAPIGVIAGSVAAGAVVVGVLAFFALRPSKGWLRKRTQRPLEASSSSFTKQWDEQLGDEGADTFIAGGKGVDTFLTGGRGLDTFITAARTSASRLPMPAAAQPADGPANLPASYLTTGPSQQLDSDAYLQGINTLLHNAQTASLLTAGQPGREAGGRASGGGADSGLLIPPELQRWVFDWSELSIRHLLGRGSYGRVFLATWRATPVAAKVLLDDAALTNSTAELDRLAMTRELLAEAQVMSAMRHPNLVTFMGVCLLPPCILTEHCSQGSLYGVLSKAARDPAFAAQLTWRRRLAMACDATRGLLYLHVSSPPIVHSDVKSPNVLVDHNWNAKVCDFNLSAFARGPGGGAAPSNPRWLAPEVLQGERASAASDTYAFAILLWELLTWQLPWGGMDPFQIRRAVLAGVRPELPPLDALPGAGAASMPGLEAYCSLMRACWAGDPQQRPTLEPVVAQLSTLLEAVAL